MCVLSILSPPTSNWTCGPARENLQGRRTLSREQLRRWAGGEMKEVRRTAAVGRSAARQGNAAAGRTVQDGRKAVFHLQR